MVYVIIIISAGDVVEVNVNRDRDLAVIDAVKLCEKHKIDLAELVKDEGLKTTKELDADPFIIGYGNQESTIWIKEVDFW